MYVPPKYAENDKAEMLAFMRQYPFALLISTVNGRLWATHLPFTIEDGNAIKFFTHQAKANNQWKELNTGTDVLVVFSQPHAFISPALYDHLQNVPTWNYIAVHAYGKVELYHDREGKERILRKAIHDFDKDYEKQYTGLDDKYLWGLMEGIVAMEITVTDIQAQFKLSQNKSAGERERIISSLKDNPDAVANNLAHWMEQYPNPEK